MSYKNVVFLVIGIIIGVRLTDIWDYVKWERLYSTRVVATNRTFVAKTQQSKHFEVENAALLFRAGQVEGNFTNGADDLPDSITALLFNEVRVLCWIMTTPENHLKRALHIRNTWGRRCTKLLFMSTEFDPYLKSVKLPVREGRSFLWHKTSEAFRYVYEHHFHEADWFLKADDDTFVIMENLRALLYQYSPEAPIYFGCKLTGVTQGYMSGGAGYVLSKAALQRFMAFGYLNDTLCGQVVGAEDKQLGICLENVGVIAGDSRDEQGQERFIPLAPVHLIPVDTSDWYAKHLFYKRKKRQPCCSQRAISFHYIKPKEFYVLDYLLYNLHIFGLTDDITEHVLPPKADMHKVLQKWQSDKFKRIGNNNRTNGHS